MAGATRGRLEDPVDVLGRDGVRARETNGRDVCSFVDADRLDHSHDTESLSNEFPTGSTPGVLDDELNVTSPARRLEAAGADV